MVTFSSSLLGRINESANGRINESQITNRNPQSAIRNPQSQIVRICDEAGVPARTLAYLASPGTHTRRCSAGVIPGIYELLDGSVSVKQVRDVRIEDLLRRDPVKTDIAAVQELLRGQRVLVTGGGGSIGSELCRQIVRLQTANCK